MHDLLFAAAGLLILIIGGDILVRGAVALSLRLGIPAMIVSLTIVAFGTSAPELLVSIKSALEGAPGLALGNVVGSNIANILLVLGVPALISSFDTTKVNSRESYLHMLAVSLIFTVLLFMGPLIWWHGALLLVLLAAMLTHAAMGARRARKGLLDDELDPEAAAKTPLWRSSLYVLAGLVALPVGADILVDAARGIALGYGVSEEVIGLTLVAVGTSLPELATTVMAALRRQAEVAMGNVIGSNMLNILAIMGITSFFGPLPVPPHMLTMDVWMMLLAALLLAPFVLRQWVLSRWVGVGFLTIYVAYTISLF